jgi:hypothetical protein
VNNKTMIFSIFAFLLSALAVTTEAKDACQLVNGTFFYCGDYGVSVGYCCNKDPLTDFYQNCCMYTAFYSLWYFWICIIGFLLFLGLCVAAVKTCKMTTSMTRVPASTTTQRANYSTQQSTVTMEDLPPTYGDVQKQGIDAQYAAYENYGKTEDEDTSTTPNSST